MSALKSRPELYYDFVIGESNSTSLGDRDLDTLYLQIKNNFIKGIDRKHILIMKPGPVEFLEDAKLSHLIAQHINHVGLDVHVFDLPSLYDKTNPNDQLYCNFEDKDLDNIWCYEFDSINKFAENNKLINIHKLSDKYPNLNLYCTPVGWQYPTYWTFNFSDTDERKINKKFWCGNWKYTEHRNILAAFLANKLDRSHMSWFYDVDYDYLKSNLWFNIDGFKFKEQIQSGSKILRDLAPVTMDTKFDGLLNPDNKSTPNIDHRVVPVSQYEESFCAIVTETKFAQPFAALTEKTMQAMIYARPFILVGPPYSLKYARATGWQTFGKWFDESYDVETNHQKRMEKILDLIKHIDSLSLEDLRKIYIDMKPVLEHNKNQLLELQKVFRNNNIDTNPYFRNFRDVY
jgi:hypothetical protein